jgi:DNA-binding XRE family transcriptional regulator
VTLNEDKTTGRAVHMVISFIPCPRCNDKKSVFFWMHNDPHILGIKCTQCNGSGKVPSEMIRWIKDGNILKNRRIKSKLLLKNAAKRLKIDVKTLSAMERGAIKPNMSINYCRFVTFKK